MIHPRISVVVATCRPHLVRPTVEALLSQVHVEPQIIVVENGSVSPSCSSWLNDEARSGSISLVHRIPAGLNGARNAGLAESLAPVVAFTDDDCLPRADWCAALLAAFEDDRTGVVGGSVELLFDGVKPDWVYGPFLGYLSAIDFQGPRRDLLRQEWLVGANIAFRREALDAVGAFNEAIGMLGDDPATAGNDEMEMVRRIRDQGGWRVVYEPLARVEHRIAAERLNSRYFGARRFGQGRADFLLGYASGEVRHFGDVQSAMRRRLGKLATYLGGDVAARGSSDDPHARVYAECMVAYALGYYRAATATLDGPPDAVLAAREQGRRVCEDGGGAGGFDASTKAIEEFLRSRDDEAEPRDDIHRWLGFIDGLNDGPAPDPEPKQHRRMEPSRPAVTSTFGSPAAGDRPARQADTAGSRSGPAASRVRLLVIDEEQPDPGRGFGFPRAAELLVLLDRARFDVTFFAARDPSRRPGSDVTPARIDALRRLLIESDRFDAVWVSRLRNLEAYLEATPAPAAGPPLIFDAEAVTSLREILHREARGERLDAAAKQRIIDREMAVVAQADMVLAVSRVEQAFFADSIRQPVLCVPSPHDTVPTPASFEQRSGAFFLNSLYWGATRHEAVDYLVGEIYPRLAGEHPIDLVLYGYGTESLELPEVDEPIAARVRIGGFVENLTATYDAHRVCVIPTRHASGVAWKAIEAMAHGVPIVTTPLIEKQLDDVGDAVLVGRDAPRFAAEIERLYRDAALWRRQRQAGLEYVSRECDRDSVLDTLRTIRRWIVERRGAGREQAGSAGSTHAPRGR